MAKQHNQKEETHPEITKDLKDNLHEVKESLKTGGNNPVKEAFKKEQQPATDADLSPLNANRQVGTTGGDQRASEDELRQASEPLESRTAKSAHDPKVPVTEDPDEDDTPIPVTENPSEQTAPVEYEPSGDGEPEKDHDEPGQEPEEIFE